MNLDPLKPYADLIRWVVALLLVALLLFAGYRWGADEWKDKHAAAVAAHKADKDRHAAVLEDLANKTAEVAKRAKAASEVVRKSRTAIDNRYREDLEDAKRREDALRADLEHGRRQLRPWWTCDLPSPAAGDAAADRAEADAARRADGTARIVAAGEADAAAMSWLWDSWMADRAAVIAAGCAVEGQ